MAEPGHHYDWRLRGLGAIVGVIVGAVALALGQLIAAFIAQPSSSVLAVGQTAIDATPEWLKSFAIRTFGANDKTALIVGIMLVLALGSVVLGVAAVRQPWVGFAGLGALGVIGIAAALGRPDSDPAWVIPSLGAGAGGAFALAVLLPPVRRVVVRGQLQPEPGLPPGAPPTPGLPTGFDRRRFFQAALALSAAAAGGGGLSVFIDRRRVADASRATVRIPLPASRAPKLAPDAQLDVPGLTSFFTPSPDFYRVDTTLFVPRIKVEDWRLRIHGMVNREIQIDFRQLIERPLIERDITLNCVSNEVGGRYVGNATWIGAALKPLLDEAGIRPGADQILSRSSDGMTIGTPTAVAMDGRASMLAVAMNGQEPLPFEHGFPVRMLVPGLYGYESATKWLVDLELTTLQAAEAYWVSRGWAQVAPIQTASRIDTPRGGDRLKAGTVAVAGVAWAQHRGIQAVEVQIDGGAWNEATLSAQDTVDTWRQWVWQWNATPGDHNVAVRATDAEGAVQPESRRPPFPSGSTGWHQIQVSVS
ncbi:MAG: molybdopterin-dependent oxidoreductase [Actinomycetota bacterium]|nr:molybdopterin-dependent oxidoreductase [Actinomycetota bacterium]